MRRVWTAEDLSTITISLEPDGISDIMLLQMTYRSRDVSISNTRGVIGLKTLTSRLNKHSQGELRLAVMSFVRLYDEGEDTALTCREKYSDVIVIDSNHVQFLRAALDQLSVA